MSKAGPACLPNQRGAVLGAVFTAQWSATFIFSNPGGGWEYPAFWAIALVVQVLIGTGLYALDNRE